MALRAAAAALVIGAAAAVAAQPADKPPAKFSKALARLDGFRLDSRDKDWTPHPACRFSERRPPACTLIETSWRVRTVKRGTRGRDAVVQELWLWRYDTAVQADQAIRSLANDFNAGPFAKHPFKVHQCGEFLIIAEGRHRFPTPLAELSRAVGKALGKRCES